VAVGRCWSSFWSYVNRWSFSAVYSDHGVWNINLLLHWWQYECLFIIYYLGARRFQCVFVGDRCVLAFDLRGPRKVPWTVSVSTLNCKWSVSLSTFYHYPTCINIIFWDSYLLAPKTSRRWVVVCVDMRFRFGYHEQFELFPRPALASEGCHFSMSAAGRELALSFFVTYVTNLYQFMN